MLWSDSLHAQLPDDHSCMLLVQDNVQAAEEYLHALLPLEDGNQGGGEVYREASHAGSGQTV